ncbi:MAG: glycosyltransferase [Blastocatellia bacterium]
MQRIKYISFYDNSGYARAARSYILVLAKAGVDLTWSPMIGCKTGYEPYLKGHISDPQLSPYFNKKINYDTVIIHTVPEYYPLWAKIEQGKNLVGYTVWETDIIPNHWADLLNGVNQLLVPCYWNKQVFEKDGVNTPIDIVPHILEEPITVSKAEIKGINPNDYVFYNIGTWTERKSPWYLIKAFCETFTNKDSVALVIKTNKEDFTRRKILGRFSFPSFWAFRKLIKQYKNAPKVILLTDELSNIEICQLHNRGDCYISLARSEGWGLGAFEAAGMGKPVIMTGFGGQLDFLRSDLAYLVKYNLVSVNISGCKTYTNNQHWAEPDLSHAKELLREVYNNTDIAKSKGKKLQEYVLNKFDSTKVIKDLLVAISK